VPLFTPLLYLYGLATVNLFQTTKRCSKAGDLHKRANSKINFIKFYRGKIQMHNGISYSVYRRIMGVKHGL
jgi:hypothetical protein